MEWAKKTAFKMFNHDFKNVFPTYHDKLISIKLLIDKRFFLNIYKYLFFIHIFYISLFKMFHYCSFTGSRPILTSALAHNQLHVSYNS